MRIFWWSFCILVWNTSFGQSAAELGKSFLQKLIRSQFDSCHAQFAGILSEKISVSMLGQIWESMPKYLGEFKSSSGPIVERNDSIETVTIPCEFQKMKLDLALTFNRTQQIVGLFFRPPKSKSTYEYPTYHHPEKYYESKVKIKTGNYELPGVLCIPNNCSDPPVAILLAGSGPNDKDETIGPNKMFLDLAIGLANNGIASLRFDKRTLVYGNEMVEKPEEIDINTEVIEDALSAIKTVKKFPVTSHSKIIIIGHSLGAFCAPVIAAKSRFVKKLVLLAGNARPLEDILFEQFQYLFGLDSSGTDHNKDLDELRLQIQHLKDPFFLKTAQSKDLPLNLSAHYWQSIVHYKPLQTAKKLHQPILVLQGGRDYQVTMTDFDIWKAALSPKAINQFLSYPELNHLFMLGKGKAKPEEYDKPGHMEESVIRDISNWIRKD
jgi:dienelactone hydrolase